MTEEVFVSELTEAASEEGGHGTFHSSVTEGAPRRRKEERMEEY